MESDDGFESFSEAIKSEPFLVLLAKWRQDVFIRKLKKLPDVVDVIPSGSLARGTHIGSVHDVDLIVVFDPSMHPDYGIKGRSKEATDSAQAAITHLENGLLEQLHPWRGAAGGLLKETEQRTHVVTYGGDWAGPFKDIIPSAPPVDVLPAVREGSHLLIPERGTGWIETDPERLMRQVEERQRQWKYFKQVTCMVKAWARLNHLKIRNLAIDVMVLTYLPPPRLFETLSCGEGVTRFFETALDPEKKHLKGLSELCSGIDPHINFGKLKSELKEAASLARTAMKAEHIREHYPELASKVPYPDELWRKLFGKQYPRTRKRFLRDLTAEPWFREYKVKLEATVEIGDFDASDASDGPDGPDGPDGGWPDGGPNRDPDDPSPGGSEPGDGRPRPSGGSGGPHDSGHPPESATEPELTEPGANLWTEVFRPAAATPSVPLTFG